MYTLILVFWFAAGNYNGGVALQTNTVTGFASETECSQEGQKATLKLAPSSRTVAEYASEVKWSCIKTK